MSITLTSLISVVSDIKLNTTISIMFKLLLNSLKLGME